MKRSVTKPKMGIFFSIVLILLTLVAMCLIVLIAWSFVKSLQSQASYVLSGASEAKLPNKFKDLTFINYIEAFEIIKASNGTRDVYLAEMFGNSLFYALSVSFVATAVPCLVAYVTARFDVWFNKVMSFIIYFNIVFQVYGSMPSMMLVTDTLGIRNSWIGIWLMKGTMLSGSYLFFKAMFKGLSREYTEAAIIDGANHWQVFATVALPLCRTIILVQFVSAFITNWNDYQTPMVYLPKYPGVSYGLFIFSSSTSSQTDYLINKIAGYMLVLLPIFVLFMIMKKYMLGNLTAGGVKE